MCVDASLAGPTDGESSPGAPARSVVGQVKSVSLPAVPVRSLARKAGLTAARQHRVLPALAQGLAQELEKEDNRFEKGLRRIGIARPLDDPVHFDGALNGSEWSQTPDGWKVWMLEVISAGAKGIRLGLESSELPPGARLIVYDAATPDALAIPITAPVSRGAWETVSRDARPYRTEIWTETVFSDRVRLECQVPPGVKPGSVRLNVVQLSHLYRLGDAPTRDGTSINEGGCHPDVTCYPALLPAANAVARMVFTISGSSYLCSGALLNDADPTTVVDYFLTANHCIPDPLTAATLECYWLYQTTNCSGPVPLLSEVPRTTGGADLLANSAGNDFALLRLRNPAPTNVYYLGWSTAAPTNTEELTGIHHPGGTFKRASFGTLSGVESDFWLVHWSEGATEPGSSGSPLLNAHLQVIGQLYGGFSHCTNQGGLDSYGRFDRTYPLIRQWIDVPLGLNEAVEFSETINENPPAAWTGQTTVTHDGVDAARSVNTADNSQSEFSIMVSGPGSLSFWWQVSSEQGYDVLSVSQDGVSLATVSGEVAWQERQFNIPAGGHIIRWRYTKDANSAVGQDAAWVDQITWTSSTPSLNQAIDYAASLAHGGNAPWFGQTATTMDGTDAAQSGATPNNGESYFTLNATGPGQLSFWWRVSSQANFDWLRFTMDGSVRASLSGQTTWQKQTFDIPEGNHLLMWRYSKDASFASGADAGWVDQVTWIPRLWYSAASNSLAVGWSTNAIGFTLQESTNLSPKTTWSPVGATPVRMGGSFIVTNGLAGRRFYRLGR